MTEEGAGHSAVRVFPTAALAAAAAAELVAAQVAERPRAVLGLATGGTMIPIYRRLVRLIREGRVSLAHVTTFNLDEYVGLAPSAPESYHAYMARHLFVPAGLSSAQTHLPDGTAADLTAAARAYDEAIVRAGGIDLQLLGIGLNGHIGFNEPGTPWDTTTHVVRLADVTRRANARFFGQDPARVPARALTMGIATILRAHRILVVATGADKAPILRRIAESPPTVACPATALRQHPAVLWFLDQPAAGCLPHV